MPADAPKPHPSATQPAAPWPCLQAARHAPTQRRPLRLHTADREVAIGSVAEAHLGALAAWPQWVRIRPEAVQLTLGDQHDTLTTHWAQLNAALRTQGLIVAWRDEPYGVWDAQGMSQATIERAASRFWGTLTLGAHCNGYVADEHGHPTHLWVAKRSLSKPTDPGRLDNLIGGGVPLGQSPWEALQREAFEEAGLAPEEIAQATPGSVIELHCDIPEGLQREHLHVFDLCLAHGRTPVNQDGEVAWHQCWPVADALAAAAQGQMTVDAALATLDFAVRWGLMEPSNPAAKALKSLVKAQKPA
jgi:8-oxo-dGTP pyrophosphatase MutT (NUDIX family)